MRLERGHGRRGSFASGRLHNNDDAPTYDDHSRSYDDAPTYDDHISAVDDNDG